MGYRRYPADIVKRIRFIKRAQALGFTLEEIAELLRLEEARACAETRALAAHKMQLIDMQKTGERTQRQIRRAGIEQQGHALTRQQLTTFVEHGF